jgi:mRNA-degrading endonuclease toxin of MazEF toxin-antitoxin module
MKKDFKKWHEEKLVVHNEKERPFFHEREVWFCILGENIGFEQDGSGKEFLRPVIIIKKFNNEICWCVPLTTKLKKGQYYFSFNLANNEVSTAILSQLRLVDVKRFQYKIGNVPKSDFAELKRKIRQFLA